MKEYCLKVNFNEKGELVFPEIPEPFGEAEEFIEKLKIMIPLNLQPDMIGVPFPTVEVLSESAKHVRVFL